MKRNINYVWLRMVGKDKKLDDELLELYYIVAQKIG